MKRERLQRIGEATQDPAVTFFLLLPLALIHLSAGRLSQSGAFSLVQKALEWVGPASLPILGLWLLFAFLWALGRVRKLEIPIGAGAALCIIEGILWGLLLGPLLLWLSDFLGSLCILGPLERGASLHSRIALAAGAGLYEELIFRALFLGGSFVLMRYLLRGLGLRVTSLPIALGLAVLGSSFFFAWAHGLGDASAMIPSVFAWRFLAGIVLGTIFCFRGLAVTAWAHAAYDALLITA